jgi:cobaltochelatase CobS
MATTSNIDITHEVLKVLEDDRDQTWSTASLVTAIQERCQTTNLPRIKTIIESLVCSNRINGYIAGYGSRKKVYSIQFKNQAEKPETETESVPQLIREMRKRHQQELHAQTDQHKDILHGVARDLMEKCNELEAEKKLEKSRVIAVQLMRGKRKLKKIEAHFHTVFPKILKLAKARKNIFLYGPTGCGKSHIAEQIAQCLNLKFCHISCTGGMSEGQLGGRLMPVGKSGTFEFVISEFLICYETGGVFLLDEIDAADANVMLFINSALANGRASVPNRPKKPYATRHEDFVCMAAANTVGTGADRLYSGRNKLDTATLDRFGIGKVCMDYDFDLEKVLCPDEQLRGTLMKWRNGINAHRLERALSTRFMIDSYDMLNPVGGDPEDAFNMQDVEEAFFQGWREDETNKVKNHVEY